MNNPNEVNELKSHLALAVQMLEMICDEAGIDLEDTCLTVEADGQTGSVSVGKMVEKWKEMTK